MSWCSRMRAHTHTHTLFASGAGCPPNPVLWKLNFRRSHDVFSFCLRCELCFFSHLCQSSGILNRMGNSEVSFDSWGQEVQGSAWTNGEPFLPCSLIVAPLRWPTARSRAAPPGVEGPRLFALTVSLAVAASPGAPEPQALGLRLRVWVVPQAHPAVSALATRIVPGRDPHQPKPKVLVGKWTPRKARRDLTPECPWAALFHWKM